MSKRSGVSYVQQDEPTFLKQFKQRIGYKEGPNVDTKREALVRDDYDDEENDDERPAVVVLKKGDLTEEEAERLRDEKGAIDVEANMASGNDVDPAEELPPPDGRIVFKKPNKRQQNDKSDLSTSTKKQKGNIAEEKKSYSKKVKNTCLLSFGEEDGEEY